MKNNIFPVAPFNDPLTNTLHINLITISYINLQVWKNTYSKGIQNV